MGFPPFLRPTAQTPDTLSADSRIMMKFELSCTRETFSFNATLTLQAPRARASWKLSARSLVEKRQGRAWERRITLGPAQYIFPFSLTNVPETWAWPLPHQAIVEGLEMLVARRYQRCLSRRETGVIFKPLLHFPRHGSQEKVLTNNEECLTAHTLLSDCYRDVGTGTALWDRTGSQHLTSAVICLA